MFKIIKKASGWWHEFNGGSKLVNLSDFNIVLDDIAQTYVIQSLNGSNIPNQAVGIADIEVIDETDASVVETFATVELLRVRLVALGYTPYLDASGLTPDQKDAIDNANAPEASNPFATMADVPIGGETLASLGALISTAGDATPNNSDYVATALTAGGVVKKITWTNVKAFLKTYYDTIYATLVSPTFTGTVTTPAIIVSSETASTIASFDASKNIKSLSTSTYPSLTELSYLKGIPSNVQNESIGLACSDETTAITTGLKVTFRMPYAMTLSSVRISLTTAPTVSTFIVDVKQNGTSIFSTLVSIDAGELTSTTASTPAVISTTALTDDSQMTVHVTQIGSGTAGSGLKAVLIGKKS